MSINPNIRITQILQAVNLNLELLCDTCVIWILSNSTLLTPPKRFLSSKVHCVYNYVYARYELQVLNWINLQVLDSSDLFAIW